MSTDEQITIETADGEMPAFVASPDDAPRGGILVVHEAFGVTSHIMEIARRLAAAGWYALAPAFFHRQGSPTFSYDNFDAVKPVVGQLSAPSLTVDVAAAVDHLERSGFTAAQTGVVGFCMGGNISFYAATTRPLGAAVTFYGGGIVNGRFGMPPLLEQAAKLQTPWLGLYGDSDQGIPTAEVEQLRGATADAAVPTEIVRYPDAGHGFNCNDRPTAFNPTAAADAWRRTLAWFGDHV